jgi:hypothetical protein
MLATFLICNFPSKNDRSCHANNVFVILQGQMAGAQTVGRLVILQENCNLDLESISLNVVCMFKVGFHVGAFVYLSIKILV